MENKTQNKPSNQILRAIAALDAANIESRPVWKPMHLQPVFTGCPCYGEPFSGAVFTNGICLPSGTATTRDDVAEVASIIRRQVDGSP